MSYTTRTGFFIKPAPPTGGDPYVAPDADTGERGWGDEVNTSFDKLDLLAWQSRPPVKLVWVDANTLRLDRFGGDKLVIGYGSDALLEALNAAGETLLVSANLINAAGADSGAPPGSSTTYYVYRSNANSAIPSAVRASATAPTAYNGVKYLGIGTTEQKRWRYLGSCETDGATQWDEDTLENEYQTGGTSTSAAAVNRTHFLFDDFTGEDADDPSEQWIVSAESGNGIALEDNAATAEVTGIGGTAIGTVINRRKLMGDDIILHWSALREASPDTLFAVLARANDTSAPTEYYKLEWPGGSATPNLYACIAGVEYLMSAGCTAVMDDTLRHYTWRIQTQENGDVKHWITEGDTWPWPLTESTRLITDEGYVGFVMDVSDGSTSPAQNSVQIDRFAAYSAEALDEIQTTHAYPAEDHTWNGPSTYKVIDAGASIGFGSLLFVASDSELEAADADAAASMPALYMATGAAVGTQRVISPGSQVRDDTWAWFPGAILYAATAAGGITATPPAGSGDQVQVIGIAEYATIIRFQPSLVLVEVA